jgi:hypothetical protein
VIVFVLMLILLRLTDFKKKRVMILFTSIYHIYITSTNIACFKLFFILALLKFIFIFKKYLKNVKIVETYIFIKKKERKKKLIITIIIDR